MPDASEQEAAKTAAQAGASESASPASSAKADTDIAPLRGYRDRFRWPD